MRWLLETHRAPIEIRWGEFKIGSSIFIPGIDQAKLTREIKREMSRLRVRGIVRSVIERGVVGIRVWRAL